jgi:hypothetical protein
VWPEQAEAWLLDEKGELLAQDPPRPCEPGTHGLRDVLEAILDWAHDLPAVTLVPRVDIAMPVHTLLRWRAEETDVGTWLGANHQVVVHWSNRIHPPRHLRSLTRLAHYRLAEIEQRDEIHGSVDWIDAERGRFPADFEERLRKNTYRAALGLRFTPVGDEDLFEALLAQFPILLWPEQEVDAWPEVEEDVRQRWVTLPGGFTAAYNRAWSGERDDDVPPLARLRAVWDDRPWLACCHTVSTHRAGIAPAREAGQEGRS